MIRLFYHIILLVSNTRLVGMGTEYTVYTAQLVEHFKIEKNTPTYWIKQELLTPRHFGTVGNRYSSADIDAFLARDVIGFEAPPTFSDITSGRLTIATPQEAAALLNLTTEGVRECMRRGRLRGFRLGHEYRYDKLSLDSYMGSRNNDEFLPFPVVEHILGVSRPIVRRLIKQGLLADASETYRRRVTRASLLKLLVDLLPDTIDPRDWVEDRIESTRPLLAPAAVAQTRKDKLRIEGLLDSGEILFIHNKYGRNVPRLILPESWFAYVERTETALHANDMAPIFGVTQTTVAAWRRKYPEYFACSEHDHTGSELYPTCLLGILKLNLTRGRVRSPRLWYAGTIERGMKVMSTKQAAAYLDMPEQTVIEILEAEGLFGLRTPPGGWCVSPESARHLLNKLKKG
jgi:excisionase family DNA binding protein